MPENRSANLMDKTDLIGRRPFVVTDLQGQFKTSTVNIVPVLHATIYRIPAAELKLIKKTLIHSRIIAVQILHQKSN